MPVSQSVLSSRAARDAIILRRSHLLYGTRIHCRNIFPCKRQMMRRYIETCASRCSNADMCSSIIKRLSQSTPQTRQYHAEVVKSYSGEFVVADRSIPEARQHKCCPLGATCGSADFLHIAGTSYEKRISSLFEHGRFALGMQHQLQRTAR